MHFEVLVEDTSGKLALESIFPLLLGQQGEAHTWRVISYKGIGRLPRGLKSGADARSRQLLDQLPRLLQGYGRSLDNDSAVIVVLDSDRKDCRELKTELLKLLARCSVRPRTLFRIAIEELEAWFLGDRDALLTAYPQAKCDVLERYVQDSICGTWEVLADAIHPGGSEALLREGWPAPGKAKCEWAKMIAPLMEMDANASPSFQAFRDGVRRLVG